MKNLIIDSGQESPNIHPGNPFFMKGSLTRDKMAEIILVLFLTLTSTTLQGQQFSAEKNVYTVAIDKEYEPYEFLNHENHADGFTTDLLREIGLATGITFTFIPMTWSEAFTAFNQGKVDLVNMIYTPERAMLYDFSIPHSQITQALFRAENAPGIQNISSLAGHRIGFQENDISLTNFANRTDFKKVIFNSKLDGLLNINIGEIDAFFCAQQPGISIILKYNFKNVDLAEGELFSQNFAFATHKGKPGLIGLLNHQINELEASGKLQALQDKWLSRKLSVPGWKEKNQVFLLTLGGILCGSFILLLIWTRSLQSRVLSKTKSLKASEERFRLLFEGAPDAMILTDAVTWNVLEVNNATCRLLGKDREDIIGIHQSDLHPPHLELSSKKIFENHLLDLQVHGFTQPAETVILRSDGAEVPVEILSQIIQINERPVVMGTFRDITGRKQAEMAARDSERKVNNILEKSPFHIWAFDGEIYNYVNKAYFDYTGLEKTKTLTPETWTNYVHPDDLAEAGKIWANAWSYQVEHDNYFRLISKEGIYRDFWCHAVPIFDEQGKFKMFQGFNIDITDRTKAEKALNQLNVELDQRVKQRTAELEDANKALESFSYSVSHDLKAPLNHIKGFINLFFQNSSTELTEEGQEYLKKITAEATHMGNLIEAMLAFARLTLAPLQKTRIHSSDMVQQVIHFYAPELENRNVTFKVAPLPDIYGDEDLLRQVWANFISNAIKYTGRKAEAVIEIGAIVTKSETTFFIKDNGAGFHMKHAEKLFGVFQRLHKMSDFEGVGIGLANVNRIVFRHGGTCRAEGEPEKGATFYFCLPNST